MQFFFFNFFEWLDGFARRIKRKREVKVAIMQIKNMKQEEELNNCLLSFLL